MNTSDIGEIIDKFIESNASAIMFDGNWGIGKTYAIKTFLLNDVYKKEIYDNCKIHYTSLFGFRNIEILHKELYKMFHPHKTRTAKALSYISLAVSLNNINIGINTSEIRKDIEDNQIQQKISKDDYKNVIIFDDIERIATQEEGFVELFGYFNRLINEGIKIIAICNSNEIIGDNKKVLTKFNEKIFDRIYTVNENNIKIIKEIFEDKFNLLDDEVIKIFENNLRLAKKTKIFIDDSLEQLIKKEQFIDNRLVCLICILIVKEVFTGCFSTKLYNEQKSKLESEDSNYNFYAIEIVEKLGTDELSIEAIERQLQEKEIYGKSSLIKGLYNYFKYYDNTYFKEETIQKKLLSKSLFYYNDEDRKGVVDEVLTNLSQNFDSFDSRQVYDAIINLLRYDIETMNENRYSKLIESIFKSDDIKRQEIYQHFENDLYFSHLDSEEKFINMLKERDRMQRKEALLQYLGGINIKHYDRSLSDVVGKLQVKQELLDDDVCKFLKERKFLLPDLSKTITENEWYFCHDICDFVKDAEGNIKDDLLKILEEQLTKNTNTKCAKERVEILKNKLKL